MVGYWDISDVAKSCREKRAITGPSTTWIWASLQKQMHEIQSNFFFEFQAADHQISTRTLESYANSLKQLAIFIIAACTLWKNIFSSSFYQRVFPVNLLTEKFYGFIAMKQNIFYAAYTSHVSISLHKIMSKQHWLFIL